MDRQSTALHGNFPYDRCLISSCLRKLFTTTHKTKVEPAYTISGNIAEVKVEIEKLNHNGQLELSYDYLAAMEASLPRAGFRYVVVYRHNTPVLFAYFQLFTLTSRNFNLEEDKSFVKGILRFFLDLKKAKVLMAGNALRNETPCLSYNSDFLDKEEAAELVASAAEEIADAENATVVMLKNIPVSTRTRKFLAGLGYHTPVPDQVMNMDIDADWKILADYIAALSRKYKTRANKILATGSTLVVRPLPADDLVHHQHTMHRLFKNVADNQSFALALPPNDHFARLKQLYGNEFEVFGFFHGERLIAFYSAFITPSAYEVYYVGFDYKLNTEYNLYFNILFAGLEQAIVLGKQQLKLGRTSFDAKASIGAKAEEITYFLKAANLPSIVGKWFVNYFSSIETSKWKLRNPLKVTQPQ
jgi:hypothetical protein